jgi:ABC-type sugar transport system permease subunit
MTKKSRLSMRHKEMIVGYAMITPWLIGLVVFFLANLYRSVQFSFNSVEVSVGIPLTPVGFANYQTIFLEHATFNRTLVESLIETVVSIPLILFFSLFVALLINRKFAFRGLVRAVIFLPVIMASPAINEALTGAMRAVMGGVSNVPSDLVEATGVDTMMILRLLTDFGLPLVIAQYVADAIISLFDIIRASGVQIIIFLAALQSVPASLYEVAKIEGATAYETFWKVTLPLVSPLILTNLIYTIIDGFSRSEVITLAHTVAFTQLNFGLSSAMSIISSLAICFILLISGYLVSRKVFYYV